MLDTLKGFLLTRSNGALISGGIHEICTSPFPWCGFIDLVCKGLGWPYWLFNGQNHVYNPTYFYLNLENQSQSDFVCTYMFVYVHVYMHICICENVCVWIHVWTCMWICVCLCLCVNSCAYGGQMWNSSIFPDCSSPPFLSQCLS